MTLNITAWCERVLRQANDLGLPSSMSARLTAADRVGAGHVLDFDGDRVIAQFIVWPNGAVEASAIAVETETEVLFRSAVVDDVAGLDSLLGELLTTVVAIENG